MAILYLSAPWHVYYKELSLLFEHDKEVRVVYDMDEQVINIYVDNAAKAEAMATVLPMEKEFGNVILTINIIPANKLNLRHTQDSVYKDLFYDNPIVNEVYTVDGIMTNPITYVVFKKEIVQYFNDDLGDAHGMCTTLYQDIAKRVFNPIDGVHFCTDTKYTSLTLSSSGICSTIGF